MKTTFKQLLKFTSCTALMALFFSCTPATGGSTTGSGTDTGTGTTITGTTGGSTTGSGTDTGTGTTITGTTGGSTTGSGTDTGTGTTITGTSGVSFSTTYNDPTLPASVGTDPFKGHTYTYSYSAGGNNQGYTFGNNNELTYTNTFTTTSGTTTSRSGNKYSYSYDANTKELSLKITHILLIVPGSTEYRWYTYAELINYYLNTTISQLTEMGINTINTDEQLREYIQNNCVSTKEIFESIYHYKAELNTSNDLTIHTNFYKTASFPLPDTDNTATTTMLSYATRQGSGSTGINIGFYLTILPSTRNISNGSGTFLSKGSILTNRISSGTSSTSFSKHFNITNITSNTISTEEYTSSPTTGGTLVSDGITLQLGYTCSLGDDDNLLVTVTGSDDTTKDFLRTLLGDDTLTNPSITASSSTYSSTYTFVE